MFLILAYHPPSVVNKFTEYSVEISEPSVKSPESTDPALFMGSENSGSYPETDSYYRKSKPSYRPLENRSPIDPTSSQQFSNMFDISEGYTSTSFNLSRLPRYRPSSETISQGDLQQPKDNYFDGFAGKRYSRSAFTNINTAENEVDAMMKDISDSFPSKKSFRFAREIHNYQLVF